MLRAALGDPKLSHLGRSYGTRLGTAYAELFPRRVRALVLDGAVDPALDRTQQALAGGRAFRRAVDDFADHCTEVLPEGCPADTPQGIRKLIADLHSSAASRLPRTTGRTGRRRNAIPDSGPSEPATSLPSRPRSY